MAKNQVMAHLEDHIRSEETKLDEIYRRVDLIQNNHLEHIREDIGEIKKDVIHVQADLKWIKLIGGFLVAQAVAVLLKLFLH